MPEATWPSKIQLMRSQSWLATEKIVSYGRGLYTFNWRSKDKMYPDYTIKDLRKDVLEDPCIQPITANMSLNFVKTWEPKHNGDSSKYKEGDLLPDDTALEAPGKIFLVMQEKQETPRKKK